MAALNTVEFDEHTWTVVDSFFEQNKSDAVVKHVIDSYNDFVLRKMDQIIDGFNPVNIYHKFMPDKQAFENQLIVNIKNPVLTKPMISEKDGSIKVMTPNDARQRSFTYAGTLYVDVDITTAVVKCDKIHYESKTIKKVNIGKIPIMLRSNYCILSKPYFHKIQDECKYDCGGYFIVNGNEKVVVSQDRIAENRTYVFLETKATQYSHVAEIRSVPENTFGPPKLTTIKLSAKPNQFGRYIRVSIHHIRHEIPLFILFRALGLCSDKEIVEYIVYDCTAPDAQLLMHELKGSIEEANSVMYPNQALEYLSKYLNITGYPKEFLQDKEQRMTIIREILRKEFLPHTTDDYHKKALYLGYMVNKLLRCYLGHIPLDDRDSYINKRVDTPGILLANLFRQYYGKLIRDMKNMIYREISSGPWKATNDFLNVINTNNIYKILKSTTIESGMKYSLATGNWGVRNNITKTKQGVAQVLNRLTYMSTISHLRRINTPMEKTGKLVQPRKLHSTQWGIICPSETPEGSSVGLVKNLSIMANITIAADATNVKELLKEQGVIFFDYTNLALFAKHTSIFVNGDLLGVHTRPDVLYTILKEHKHRGTINIYTSVVWNVQGDYISVCTDAGRCIRPLYVVDNHSELRLTKSHIRGILQGKLTWNDLVCPATSFYRKEYDLGEGAVIEYLDVEEVNHAMIAMKHKDLVRGSKGSSLPVKYTHLEVHPSLVFGVLASNIPFPDHNQAPRNTYQCLWKEEPVLMADGTWKAIKDVHVGEEVMTFHPETMEPSISPVVYHYVRPTDKLIYDITTISGRSVRATVDHRFMTSDGWKTVEEMLKAPGQHDIGVFLEPIEPLRDHHEVIPSTVVMDEKIWNERVAETQHYAILRQAGVLPLLSTSPHVPRLARLCGYLLAKGEFHFKCEADTQAFEADCARLGLHDHHGVLQSLCIALGGKKVTSSHTLVPDWVMNGSTMVVREYLAGFQGGDGCDNWHTHPLCEQPLRYFMGQVSLLFTRMGIENQVTHYEVADHRVAIGVKLSETQETTLKIVERIGCRYNRTKLVELAMRAEYIRWKFQQYDRRGNDSAWIHKISSKGNMIFVPIKSISLVSEAVEVSDITVASENHSFVTRDGLASSNCAMGKQAIGIYATNFLTRMDTLANVLNYPQKPLVDTKVSKFLHSNDMPSGVNVIVAIATYTGYNQEDSVIVNRSAIERGLFNSTYYRNYKEHCVKNHSTGEEEIFCKPDEDTRGYKPFNYDKLEETGFVKENTYVEQGDILIGKCMPQKVDNMFVYKDNSVVVKNNESGFVDRNCSNDQYFKNVNNDGYVFSKVRVRNYRAPIIGDKFSSRHGQKGTMGMMYNQADMPYNREGICPDIIMNPHAVPSRMTIAQLMECILGKACVKLGTFGDGTPFTDLSVEDIAQILEANGIERYGNEILHDPRTGLQMPTLIFMGPTYYQRLKHMVTDKVHSRAANGPIVLMTRQPAEGRSREGGLRMGEMEVECNWGHGTLQFLKERLMECSDNYRVFVCNKCCKMSNVNPEKGVYICKLCKNTTNFSQIRIPYACKLLFQEIQSMGITPKFVL